MSGLHVVRGPGSAYRITLRVTNTGRYAGAQVVQAYVQFPARAGEPPRQLKAFARVSLARGARRTVVLTLPATSFSYFDAHRGSWTVARGRYRLLVGPSSRDLPLRATIVNPR